MYFVFFILSPFLTFLYSCFDLNKRMGQIIFVLFFGLFGYCHTFSDIRADSYRKYESFAQFSTNDFDYIIESLATGESKDIFEPLLYCVVKSFSDNPHIMMMIVGLWGGFFYMLVLKRFLQDRKVQFTAPIVILLVFMVIESNIPLMGGIRNFCAFPLFIYSLIKVLIDNKKIWIIGLLLTPLIHFSYTIVVVAALFAWLIKLPNGVLHYVAITICFASLFLDTTSYGVLADNFIETLDNESAANRISQYNSEDTDLHFNSSMTTKLNRVNNKIGAVYIAILLMYLYRNRKRLKQTIYEQKIYNLLLFFVVISFSLISFSVVGQRYVYIAMVLIYFYLLNIYQRNPDTAISKFIYTMPIIYSIHIAWTVYNCYCNVGLDIIYQPLPFLIL